MSNGNDIILLGGGGHCKSVIDAAESVGYNILGILDKPELVGTRILNYEIIGTDDDIPHYADKAQFVITVGQIKSPAIRQKLAQLVERAGGRFATVIASDAYVSKYAHIGEGTVVLHKAMVNADAHIGRHCIINTMANIEHDVKIGDFCHISTGAMVNGGCIIEDETFVGSGAVLHQCAQISKSTIVPAGTIVRKNA
ncbi:MAG: acetyltransferase [Paludibacteraceae bacterium]|nr:acetyltransferase [Paludibacteraceae bacterium]